MNAARNPRKTKGRTGPAGAEGISPVLLLEQVQSTAGWALADLTLPSSQVLQEAAKVEELWQKGDGAVRYLQFLCAAHFTTVATFVPTDVDQRIRELAWATLSGAKLHEAVDRVLDATTWDVRPVTARYIQRGADVLAGHEGEWFSVLAGALGRALTLNDAATVARTQGWIDAELEREARLFTEIYAEGDPRTILATSTILAHNLGDLSRVVDTWSKSHRESELGASYQRLGHHTHARWGETFVLAGDLNKEFMALENHRFLPLRVPRTLRKRREFIMPIGPYFFDWGQQIATSPYLDDGERAEILAALLLMHDRRAEEHGCLRAIAGLHSAFGGGLDKLARLLTPSVRALTLRGPVRSALKVKEREFLRSFHAPLTKRLR